MLMFVQLVTVCLSVIFFSLFNACFPDRLRLNLNLTAYQEWKFRNIIISLVHSVFSGFCSFYLSLDYVFPESSTVNLLVIEDSVLGRFMFCVSIGYFIYDALLSYTKISDYPGRFEIIVHHVISMTTLFISLLDSPVMRIMYSCCVFALVIEISNVFIHIRSLIDLSHRSLRNAKLRSNPFYKLNSVYALIALFVFRFLPLYWITKDLMILLKPFSHSIIAMLHFPIFAILIISSVIFWRIIYEDLLSNEPIALD